VTGRCDPTALGSTTSGDWDPPRSPSWVSLARTACRVKHHTSVHVQLQHKTLVLSCMFRCDIGLTWLRCNEPGRRTGAPAHSMPQPASCVSETARTRDWSSPEGQQTPAHALLSSTQWPGSSLQMSTALVPVMSGMW
jgi:hypothetical protein